MFYVSYFTDWKLLLLSYGTGCSGKMCFFAIHWNHGAPWLQPIPRLHVASRSLQNSQSNGSEQTFLFFERRPIAAKCWRGKGGKILKKSSWKNTNFFPEHHVAEYLNFGANFFFMKQTIIMIWEHLEIEQGVHQILCFSLKYVLGSYPVSVLSCTWHFFSYQCLYARPLDGRSVTSRA